MGFTLEIMHKCKERLGERSSTKTYIEKNTRKPRIMGLFLSVHDSGYSLLKRGSFCFYSPKNKKGLFSYIHIYVMNIE